MEDKDYEQIEADAKQIIGTLNKLKQEIEGYKQAKLETKKSLESLDGLLDAMAEAAKLLAEAADDIQKSDYLTLYKGLVNQSTSLKASCESFSAKIDELPNAIQDQIAQHALAQEKRDTELLGRISELETVIARIDRNTQKGFGKERG